MKHWGIRTRVMMLAVAPAVLLASVLTLYFTFSRITDAEDALQRLGATTARHLASSAEYGVVSGNRTLLQGLARSAVKDSYTRYALITDADMGPLAAAGTPPAPPAGGAHASSMGPARGDYVFRVPITLSVVESRGGFGLDGADSASPPAPAAAKPIGWVVVAMSHTALDQGRSRMLAVGLAIVIGGILVTAALAAGWGTNITRPVRDLSRAVEKLEKGELGARVAPVSGGELLRLQDGFNRMAESLQTHQAELQRRIRAATADLAEKKEEAERANQAKSSFLAAVSHDLRQPMHAVGLFAAALRDRVTTAEQRELVQRIEDSLNALQVMFEALLDISRLDAGAIHPSIEPCDLRPLLTRVGQDCSPLATEKNLRLRLRLRAATGISDSMLLGRMLGNLVSNAVRYTERGGILVGCRRRGDRWLIQVWDTGVGIAAEHLPHVFGEYFQVGNEARSRSRGVGLGLAIVRKIGLALGHPVDVRSQPGRGSVFSISVPAASDAPVERRSAPREIGLFSGETVLVIDDDPDALESMGRLLSGWNLRPVLADGPDAALAHLRSQVPPPCLVVCDYRLPRTTGTALIHFIRAEAARDVPALIVTGDTAAESLAAMRACGLPVLAKPVRPAKLRALISALLRGRSPPAA